MGSQQVLRQLRAVSRLHPEYRKGGTRARSSEAVADFSDVIEEGDLVSEITERSRPRRRFDYFAASSSRRSEPSGGEDVDLSALGAKQRLSPDEKWRAMAGARIELLRENSTFSDNMWFARASSRAHVHFMTMRHYFVRLPAWKQRRLRDGEPNPLAP